MFNFEVSVHIFTFINMVYGDADTNSLDDMSKCVCKIKYNDTEGLTTHLSNISLDLSRLFMIVFWCFSNIVLQYVTLNLVFLLKHRYRSFLAETVYRK